MPLQKYNRDLPWNRDVNGDQVLPLINDEFPVFRIKAGPGTGKTFGLRRRVLRLLHPQGAGINPKDILVCAFNRIIAKELSKEICEELKPYGLKSPVVSTVHGLCAKLTGRLSQRILLPHEEEGMVYDIRTLYPHIIRPIRTITRSYAIIEPVRA